MSSRRLVYLMSFTTPMISMSVRVPGSLPNPGVAADGILPAVIQDFNPYLVGRRHPQEGASPGPDMTSVVPRAAFPSAGFSRCQPKNQGLRALGHKTAAFGTPEGA